LGRPRGQGVDQPRQFAAFLHTLRWNCVTATDPNLSQAPFRAGIKIDAYQMEPLRKALRLPRANLFIADDTGLGKTIEAGLIARELLLRKKAKTIVVATPPSVLEQWKAELEDRFGLVFELLDRAYLTRMRRERGFGVNPWRTRSRFLISHNLLIDPAYADPLREWLGPFLPGSLLVLDEAHHAAPASGGRYGIEAKFTRAVRDLAGRFEHRLFLSATPHNGHSNSFSTLLELLDPYRFTRGVEVRGKKALEDVMVRRLKEDIRNVQGGYGTLSSRVIKRVTRIGYIERQFPREINPPAPQDNPTATSTVWPLSANSGRSHVGWQWLNSTQAEVYERIRGVRRKADLADRL
jgi:SNF2 family DNA or RNA helicase